MNFLICLLSLFVAALARPDFSYEFQQPLPNNGKHWAVIVAGSNGYFNYRHQADACHAYHIMNKHGIPDEQIVMMMYDDIANNRENPVKGNIINRPNGQNLYPGVPKDYTGEEVNPTNFLNILLGKSSGGKKVINSTANDFVFINFIDHGAPGILGFGDRFRASYIEYMHDQSVNVVLESKPPDKNGGPNDHVFVNFVDHGAPGILGFGNKFLKVKDLMNTINQMHDEKRYAKMVFYIEACESGSMMENLPENINVYATTASNPHESSYACYFDKTRQTYLGDVYSIKWMQDSDKEDLNTETLHKQFLITQKETNTSHVMEYGDKTMGKMTVAEFQGTQQARSGSYRAGDPCGDSVKSEDVPLEILRRRLQLARTADEAADIASKLIMLQKEREMVNKTVQEIVERTVGTNFVDRVMNGPRSSIRDNNWDCYSNVVDIIQAKCKKTLNIPMNDYALRKLYMFVTMCDAGVPVQAMERAINEVCM